MGENRRLFGSTKTKASSLPVSRSESKLNEGEGGIRRRLSSLSLKIQDTSTGPSNPSWSFPRSKSLTSMGDYARTWWDWSWAWILSRKPIFATVTDLEMNHNRGTCKHFFYKLRSEIRRLITSHSDHAATLPQTSYHVVQRTPPQLVS